MRGDGCLIHLEGPPRSLSKPRMAVAPWGPGRVLCADLSPHRPTTKRWRVNQGCPYIYTRRHYAPGIHCFTLVAEVYFMVVSLNNSGGSSLPSSSIKFLANDASVDELTVSMIKSP